MDIEQTLKAIAESQLRAEKRAEAADKRMDRAEKRAEAADKRMDRAEKRADAAEKRTDALDKQLKATAQLVRYGLKLVIEDRKDFKYRINALIASQNRMDERLDRYLKQSRHSNGNGRH